MWEFNDVEFKKLCSDFRQKGIIRTHEEVLNIMINITRIYFDDFM